MTRDITIEEAFTGAKTPIASIRLRGVWLTKSGFVPKGKVRVMIISEGMIVMRAMPTLTKKQDLSE